MTRKAGKYVVCLLDFEQQGIGTKTVSLPIIFLIISTYYVIIYYCRCRHWSISQFFGDEKPDCNNSCDACKDPKSAEKNLAELQRGLFASVNKTKGAGTMFYVDEDVSGDMYGGGRKGAKM